MIRDKTLTPTIRVTRLRVARRSSRPPIGSRNLRNTLFRPFRRNPPPRISGTFLPSARFREIQETPYLGHFAETRLRVSPAGFCPPLASRNPRNTLFRTFRRNPPPWMLRQVSALRSLREHGRKKDDRAPASTSPYPRLPGRRLGPGGLPRKTPSRYRCYLPVLAGFAGDASRRAESVNAAHPAAAGQGEA